MHKGTTVIVAECCSCLSLGKGIVEEKNLVKILGKNVRKMENKLLLLTGREVIQRKICKIWCEAEKVNRQHMPVP